MSNIVEIRINKRIVEIVDNKADVRTVQIVNGEQKIVSITPTREKTSIISKESINRVVTVRTQGPQGQKGDQGIQGETGLFQDGTNLFAGNVTASIVSASSFLGDGSQLSGVQTIIDSSSFAITSSNVLFGNITSSADISASGNIQANAFTGTFTGVAAQIKQEISGSFTEESASFSNRIQELEGNPVFSSLGISGSFTEESASFSNRVSANEVIVAKTLISSSAQIKDEISGSLGPNEDLIRSLSKISISGSFTEDSASFEARTTILETASGSLSIRTTNLENTSANRTFNHITSSGNISASGNLIVSESLTFGADLARIGAGGELQIRGLATGNEYFKIADNRAQIFIQGSQVVNIDDDSINLNASNQNIDVKIAHDNGVNAFQTDASQNRVKIRDFVTIGSGSAPNANPNALYVKGSQFNDGHITSSGDISSSGTIIAHKYADVSSSGTGSFNRVEVVGDIIATGIIVGSEIHTTFISSSVTYSTGSNQFGDELTDIHEFTGSVKILGAMTSNGLPVISSSAQFTATDDVQFGSITASIISSSGTIKAATLDADAITDGLASVIVAEIDDDEIPIAKLAQDAVTITAGNGLIDGGSVTLGSSVTLNVAGGTGVTANADNISIGQDVATSANVEFAHITASGNISASGDLFISKINVYGPAGNSGQIYINDSDNGTGVADGFFLNKSGINAFIYNRDTGNLELGTNDLRQVHIMNTATDAGLLKIEHKGINIAGHITASGDISASGNIKATQGQFYSGGIISNGNTILGNSSNDTHKITGNITASGDISASGDLRARNIRLTDDGGGVLLQLDSSTGDQTIRFRDLGESPATQWDIGRDNSTQNLVISTDAGLGEDDLVVLTKNSNISFNGPITASGDISASGNIISLTGSFHRAEADSFAGTFIGVAGQIEREISGSFTQESASFSNRVTNLETDSGSFSNRVSANEVIVAKTLISSSAQIKQEISGSFTEESASFSNRVTNLETTVNSNDRSFNHISASGNISSSGNLIGDQLILDGGTFTSASLAAGGGGGSGDGIFSTVDIPGTDSTQKRTANRLLISGSVTVHTSSNLDESHINGADWNPYNVFQITSDARNDSGFNINGLTNTEVLPRHLYTFKGGLPRIGLNAPIPSAMLHLSASSANSASIRLDNNVSHIDLRLHEKIAHITGSYDKLAISGSVETGHLSTIGVINIGDFIQSGSLTIASGSQFQFGNPGLSEIRTTSDNLLLTTQGILGGTVKISGSAVITRDLQVANDVIANGYIIAGIPNTTVNTVYAVGDDLYWNGKRVKTDNTPIENERIESSGDMTIATSIAKNLFIETGFISSSQKAINFGRPIGLPHFTSSNAIASYPTSSLLGGEMCVLVGQTTPEISLLQSPWNYGEDGLGVFAKLASDSPVVNTFDVTWNWHEVLFNGAQALPDDLATAYAAGTDVLYNQDQHVLSVGTIIKIGNEQMLVTANDNATLYRVTGQTQSWRNTLTIQRAVNGTTQQGHSYRTFMKNENYAASGYPFGGDSRLPGFQFLQETGVSNITEQPYMYSKYENKWIPITLSSADKITSTAT